MKNEKIKLMILAAVLFLGGFFAFPGEAAAAATNVGGFFSTSRHWTLAGSPYIVRENNSSSGVSFGSLTTLTIDPGVVVKLEDNAQILTGTVIAQGTEEQPVIFTSVFDDAADGQDSDGLGPTTGSVGDWNRFTTNSGASVLDHVIIRYSSQGLSGYGPRITNSIFEKNGIAIQISNSISPDQAVIENNIIRNNSTGIEFTRALPANFTKNNIFEGQSANSAFNETTNYPVDMSNNWWGDPSGPTHASNPNGHGERISNAITYTPWLTTKPGEEPPPPPPQGKRPVLIIPGIAGSELFNSGDLIWPDLEKMFLDINDQFLTDNLLMRDDGFSLEPIIPGEIIDKIAILDIFEALITELESNGYEENQTYYVFPYDWRLDLDQNTVLLNEKMEDILAETP